jgi:hypothetical protein
MKQKKAKGGAKKAARKPMRDLEVGRSKASKTKGGAKRAFNPQPDPC